jgi:hypothetical protein
MDYSDSEFLAAFDSGSLAAFHHRDHVRLALLFVQRYGMPEAEQRLAAAIRRFAEQAGQSAKYHHTMTVAWVRLAARILDKTALDTYYSPTLLQSDRARQTWVEPDLARLP